MKLFLIWLGFISILSVDADDFGNKVRQNIIKSTVKIMSIQGNHGSGVVVYSEKKQAVFLTNQHVCKELLNFTLDKIQGVVIVQEEILPIESFVMSHKSDLCVLLTNTHSKLSAVELSKNIPMVGEEVINVGFPFISSFSMTTGYIGGGYFRLDNNYFYQEVSVSSFPGSSGSGVFNTDGKLVGLLSAGGTGVLSGMVDLVSIIHFLQTKE